MWHIDDEDDYNNNWAIARVWTIEGSDFHVPRESTVYILKQTG